MRRWMQTAVCAALVIMLTIQDVGVLTPGPVSAAAATEAPTAPQLKAGYYHSVSLVSGGTVYTWGQDSYGQLGNNSTVSGIASPVGVKKLTGIVDVDSGVRSSIALKQDGTVWMWGGNMNGQLGIGSTAISSVPVQVPGLRSISAISGGIGYHSMALASDGTVWTWGENKYAQLGDGTRTNWTTPVQASNLEHITAIAGGGYHSLALDDNGNVWGWGDNSQGQLGQGNKTLTTRPLQVAGITGVKLIAAGGFHSLAMRKDGVVWGWGLVYYIEIDPGAFTAEEGKDYDGMQGVDGWSFTTASDETDPGSPGTGPFDTALSSLRLTSVSDSVRLDPAFERNRYQYSADVAYSAAAVTIAGEV
ncbi:hypothetical protein AWM70_05920 [Paenibacillus yonginensis]|uniref:RCC1-like domain-containing protein n=1 Tax=Paenibacillus yonginensis TaxID=1462996 RepID=A0A1B1MYC7_9BACL|nr:hypothetical protein [Paenibacillus yonginensis]ANS74175.1 hypothetical protein AWM70_05920 [Paenibacillus yonginensis]